MQAKTSKRLLLLLICLQAGRVIAAEADPNSDEQMPSTEMLKFLGDYSNDKGEWTDPTKMDDMKLPEEETDAYDSD